MNASPFIIQMQFEKKLFRKETLRFDISISRAIVDNVYPGLSIEQCSIDFKVNPDGHSYPRYYNHHLNKDCAGATSEPYSYPLEIETDPETVCYCLRQLPRFDTLSIENGLIVISLVNDFYHAHEEYFYQKIPLSHCLKGSPHEIVSL